MPPMSHHRDQQEASCKRPLLISHYCEGGRGMSSDGGNLPPSEAVPFAPSKGQQDENRHISRQDEMSIGFFQGKTALLVSQQWQAGRRGGGGSGESCGQQLF